MIQTGSVVKSVAGHDKNKFYIVLTVENDRVYIADGKARKLLKPKAKNLLHIKRTNTVLDLQVITTDKQLRIALKPFNESLTVNLRRGR